MFLAMTGATGLLGRHLVAHMAEAGHRLRCWHRPASDRGGFESVAGAVEWVPGQLGDPAATDALVCGADAVVHAAVEWRGPRNHAWERQGDLRPMLEHNLMGSLRLLQAAHAAGVPRFVFISSGAVHEVILPDRPLDETHPLWPTTHYGACKAAVEAFVHSFGLGEGWAVCALRPTGIYGLAHPPERSKWFDLVGQVVRGEPVATAKGAKEVHAADVAKAAELLLTADTKVVAGQAFNCCDRYVSEQEVARIARELTGSKSEIADLNRGPKNRIETGKLRALGMTFGGEGLLRQTVGELVRAHGAMPTR